MKKSLIAITLLGLAFGETKVEERQMVSVAKCDIPSNIKLTQVYCSRLSTEWSKCKSRTFPTSSISGCP